jgi:glutamate racemase
LEKNNGKIGIFDSGLGGLTILKEVIKLMPNWEYLYLGDNLRTPYGEKTQAEIFKYTLAGVEWLFGRGAEIVILACNTASANALRKIQQEVLPFKYQNKRVLGIIIPTVENIGNFNKSGHIGVLATKATIASGVFKKETKKYWPEIRIISQSGGRLAELIEQNKTKKELKEEIEKVIGQLIERDGFIDTIILGCTHYALIENQIRKVLPENINVINQGKIVADKLADYFNRHNDLCQKLSANHSVCFYTTSYESKIKKLMAQFYGAKISVFQAYLALDKICA